MELSVIENELKKRWKLPYYEDNLRIDIWQDQTAFVNSIESFDELNDSIFQRFNSHKKFEDLKNYAINRWYNHLSEKGIRSIFKNHKRVRLINNSEGKSELFYIEAIPYQVRIFEFDKIFAQDIQTVQNKRLDFAKALLQNSGVETSVIYLALASSEGVTARLRCELKWLEEILSNYLEEFNKKEIARVNRGGHISFTDLLIAKM